MWRSPTRAASPLSSPCSARRIRCHSSMQRACSCDSPSRAPTALIIKKLVEMLEEEGSSAQEQAAAALANLASDSAENRVSIVDAGGIALLLRIIGHKENSKAKEASLMAISSSRTTRLQSSRDCRGGRHPVARQCVGDILQRHGDDGVRTALLTRRERAVARKGQPVQPEQDHRGRHAIPTWCRSSVHPCPTCKPTAPSASATSPLARPRGRTQTTSSRSRVRARSLRCAHCFERVRMKSRSSCRRTVVALA